MLKKNKIFSIVVKDPDAVERRLGINQVNLENSRTRLLDIIDEGKKKITLINNTKKSAKCDVAYIDYRTKEIRKKKNVAYHCYWCKHEIDTDNVLGCPIKFMHNQLVKNIKNDINSEIYSIRENTTETNDNIVKSLNSKNITCEFDRKNYYIVDGAFCSFNCALAFIRDNCKDKFYANSEMLLYKMYADIHAEFDLKIDEIPDMINCAPHWRLLKIFGGEMSIEEFRSSFANKIFTTHDYLRITQAPSLTLYEHQIKL